MRKTLNRAIRDDQDAVTTRDRERTRRVGIALGALVMFPSLGFFLTKKWITGSIFVVLTGLLVWWVLWCGHHYPIYVGECIILPAFLYILLCVFAVAFPWPDGAGEDPPPGL